MTGAPRQPPAERRQSLVVVNTGDGKGKTSAAMGMALRGIARDWRVGVIRFIKSGKWKSGEAKLSEQLGIDWWSLGDGFTWESTDLDNSARLGREAWTLATDLIAAGAHQLVILDEVTYPINFDWISVDDVINVITGRPPAVNIILTGRDAPDELIAVADTVTEMRNVKHAYDQGIRALKGIDY